MTRSARWARSGRIPLLLAILAAGVLDAGAAVRTSARTGLWRHATTWAGGGVPLAADEVVIAPGHLVVFSGPSNVTDECARLVVQPGAELVIMGPRMRFDVGGNGVGIAGGVEIFGRMNLSGGVTLSLRPDGNAQAAEDGVIVRPGGHLSLEGEVLHQSSVASVVSDDNLSDIYVTDFSLPQLAFDPDLRVVWRSGLRKGRWYDVAGITGATLILDHDSRSNAQRIGQPDYREGLASVSGRVVTGSGTAWSDAIAAGSWWWCDADGFGSRARVEKVLSPTSLMLASVPLSSACASPGAYTLRDENQPHPAADVTEQVRAGDRYQLIRPAVVRSAAASDDDFDHQIFVRVDPGAGFYFHIASFESVGKEAWAAGGGSGITIRGFQGGAGATGFFDTVEVYRFAGEAGVEWEDSSRFDVDWLYLHWAHPMISLSNEGHGVKIEHTRAEISAADVRIRNARFDRTNDDFVWWASRSGGSSGVYDSIGKYCPSTASGHSCDALDTNDRVGSPGGQIRIERNLFTNIGAAGGGSCLQAAAPADRAAPAWRGDGWVARDNVCLNLQTASCMVTYGPTRAWDREAIWAVNNVCLNVSGNGIEGIPRVFQNQILNFGLVRRDGADGIRDVYEARGNILRSAERRTPDASFTPRGITVGTGLGVRSDWTGTGWTISDNVLLVSGTGLAIGSWSSASFPSTGDGLVSHNLFLRPPRDSPAMKMFGIYDVHESPAGHRVFVRDNIFEAMGAGMWQAGAGYGNSAQDTLEFSVVHRPIGPDWIGLLESEFQINGTTGILPFSDQPCEIRPGSAAWTAPTSDGTRAGPRFAGTLSSRFPWLPGDLMLPVDPDDDEVDSDSDALIDRWDNCPGVANPGWADADADGAGDACDPD